MAILLEVVWSKSLTAEEWAPVYEETLQMIKAFPLGEKQTKLIAGVLTPCLVRSKERVHTRAFWGKEEDFYAWKAIGDYETRQWAEEHVLARELVKESEVNPEAHDAMIGLIPAHLPSDFSFRDYPYWNDVNSLLVGPTGGGSFHMYLLAIACMIEARLGSKAFVDGEITWGQCKKAVEMANEVLDEPISMPARCELDWLYARVDTLPFDEEIKYKVFHSFYLGREDEEYGRFVRSHYSPEALSAYWKKRFEGEEIGGAAYHEELKRYLETGFELKNLWEIVDFSVDMEEKYEHFVESILDTKIYQKEKDTYDWVAVDTDQEVPYSNATLFAQMFLAGAHNKKANRYIPLDDLREQLKECVGEQCDVDACIDRYLVKEAEKERRRAHQDGDTAGDGTGESEQLDAAEELNQIMEIGTQYLRELDETYDIADWEDLPYYKKGDSIEPALCEGMMTSFDFYRKATEEATYRELMRGSARNRCKYLAEENGSLLLRDTDWKKICKDVRKNKEAFARYYPMVRVKITSSGAASFVLAIVVNDDLYEYCSQSAERNEK